MRTLFQPLANFITVDVVSNNHKLTMSNTSGIMAVPMIVLVDVPITVTVIVRVAVPVCVQVSMVTMFMTVH